MATNAKKLKKLHTLLASQEMAEDILTSLYSNLTEESSDEDFMVFGRMQMAVLVTEAKIRNLRHELGLPHKRFKHFPLK